jgi:hypothetical protein
MPRALALAGAVLAVLALHTAYKLEHDLLGEMLWTCHVASLVIAIGLVARRAWLVAVGTAFHLAVGLPSFVLDAIATQHTTVTSVLVHTVPPGVGLHALRHQGPWPRWTPIASGGLYVALVPLSRWLTEPALNVNLAFAPWPPLATISASPWVTWLANVVAMSILLLAVDRWMRRWSAGRAAARSGRLAHG